MLTLDDIGRRIAVGNFQELNVIVKGDVDGSVEALVRLLDPFVYRGDSGKRNSQGGWPDFRVGCGFGSGFERYHYRIPSSSVFAST